MNTLVQPTNWNDYYQCVLADEIPWEVGGPSPELEKIVHDGIIVPPARVLDIGCGLGSQAQFLAQHGFETVGIDIAPTAITKAKKLAEFTNTTVTFQVADVASAPFKSESFDVVYDRICFHHLIPQEQAAYRREVNRLLTDGGVLLLTVFAQGLAPEILEQFFAPHFELLEEAIFPMRDRETNETILLRSLLFEKYDTVSSEAN